MIEQDLEEIFDELKTLIISKNRDYGDSFHLLYEEFGLQSVYIRLKDKINRLGSLVSKEAEVKDETIKDTLSDLINYSILTLLELEK